MNKKAAGSRFLLLAHSRHRPARGPNTPPPVAEIEIDNQQVRVVCRRYAPHENFPIHSHPDGVVVYLTEVRTEQDSNGKTTQITRHTGDVNTRAPRTRTRLYTWQTLLLQMQIELKSPRGGTSCQSARSTIAALHCATGRGLRCQIASRISLFANRGDLSACGLKIYMLFSREVASPSFWSC